MWLPAGYYACEILANVIFTIIKMNIVVTTYNCALIYLAFLWL